MTTERAFLGIWIPKEILKLGLPDIRKWVLKEYKIDLLLANPLMEGDQNDGI